MLQSKPFLHIHFVSHIKEKWEASKYRKFSIVFRTFYYLISTFSVFLFILQVALYCRHDLNLRSPTNLLLAFASLYKPCRPYLPRYFSACINIPSDWIAVADFVKTFSDEGSDAYMDVSARNLPAILRKVMVAKFSDFDEYQLAKYNKQTKVKKVQKDKVSNNIHRSTIYH